MTKKVYSKEKYFSVITKIQTGKILTKNLLTFIRQDGVKGKKL